MAKPIIEYGDGGMEIHGGYDTVGCIDAAGPDDIWEVLANGAGDVWMQSHDYPENPIPWHEFVEKFAGRADVDLEDVNRQVAELLADRRTK